MTNSTNSDKNENFRNKLEESLFKARTVMIFGEINQKLAKQVTEKLLVLSNDSDEDIRVYINSQGGHVEAGDTIFDMIRFVRPQVKIIGTGWVASAGALIYCAADPENRYSLPNTRFMIHQPIGGVGGTASDVEIEAKEIVKMRRRLNEILARQTGQPLERIEEDTDRNFWMTPEEAKKYGLVTHIINSLDELK